MDSKVIQALLIACSAFLLLAIGITVAEVLPYKKAAALPPKPHRPARPETPVAPAREQPAPEPAAAEEPAPEAAPETEAAEEPPAEAE